MTFHTVSEAIDDLRQGRPVIVVDDEDRENEGDLVALAEHATPEVINFMITHGRGLVCAPLTEERARTLDLPLMVEKEQNVDRYGTAFTVSVDHKTTTTGISAHERARTVQALIRPDARAHDFRRPGHIFPLIAKKGGVLKRAGHTEAAVDLAQLAGSVPAGVICEVVKSDGTMARVPELTRLAEQHALKMITIEDLIRYRIVEEHLVTREASVQMPTAYGRFTAIAYTNPVDDQEVVALVKGEMTPDEPILVRIHSECLTGDVFASLRCDCGPQLHAALRQIEAAGKGVLVYMRQEGRGIGLLNKLRAYELQEQGLDTVEANERLGFPPDSRDYGIGAQILRDLGVERLKLMTNNPRKIKGLTDYGLDIAEVVPLQMPANAENEKYLTTKKSKLGHLLTI